MARRSYPLRRYAKYRTILNAGSASVGISEFKVNPIKYIYAAESRPIKILRYGHLSALLITPEFYDELATDLENVRAELANLKVLLSKISPDLAYYWDHQPGDFIEEPKRFTETKTQRLPELTREYVRGVEELLDDLENESDNPNPTLDRNLSRLASRYRSTSGGARLTEPNE